MIMMFGHAEGIRTTQCSQCVSWLMSQVVKVISKVKAGGHMVTSHNEHVARHCEAIRCNIKRLLTFLPPLADKRHAL